MSKADDLRERIDRASEEAARLQRELSTLRELLRCRLEDVQRARTECVPLWVREFGEEYDVPPVVAAIAEMKHCCDLSYRNDSCPSFGYADEEDDYRSLRIHSEHPISEQRECYDRFVVWQQFGSDTEPETLYSGDDVDAAISVFMKAYSLRFNCETAAQHWREEQ